MAEAQTPLEALEAQIAAISDTHKNVVGLIQKVARMREELAEAGFQTFSDQLADPFAALSGVAEQIQALVHTAEIERNRIRNEG